MNKKIIRALVAVTLSASTLIQVAPTAQANTVPAIAILDTALNSSLPIFKDKVVHEVCIMEWNSCPNGKSFMEGPGSAQLPVDIMSAGGFDHGTQMASVSVTINPNVKIVFIRIIGNVPGTSQRQDAGFNTVSKALDWVNLNAEKFNIKSVAMAQANYSIISSTEAKYCPSDTSVTPSIKSLLAKSVPVFFAAGNNRDYKRIAWPSCIAESVSVSMSDEAGELSNFSNYDANLLDFYALGAMPITNPNGSVKNGSGSSISAIVAGTVWAGAVLNNPKSTYNEIMQSIVCNSKFTKGARGQQGNVIPTSPIRVGTCQGTGTSAPVVAPVVPAVPTKQQLVDSINKSFNDEIIRIEKEHQLALINLNDSKNKLILDTKAKYTKMVSDLG
jgi:hypothetical protein